MSNAEKITSWILIAFIVLILVIVMFRPGLLDGFGESIARFLIAICGGLLAGVMGGKFEIQGKLAGFTIRGIGGVGVFFAIFFLWPAVESKISNVANDSFELQGKVSATDGRVLKDMELTFETGPAPFRNVLSIREPNSL